MYLFTLKLVTFSVCMKGLLASGCWNGSDYNGNVSVTVEGIPCQRWDVNLPHVPYSKFLVDGCFGERNVTQVNNYCQVNKCDNYKYPWCYTTDPSVRWQSCDIPPCKGYPSSDCIPRPLGANYIGNKNSSAHGYDCLRWNKMTSPHKVLNLDTDRFFEKIFHILDASNYCRNPVPYSSVMPWCFVEMKDGVIALDYCDIPWCEQLDEPLSFECITSSTGMSYVGTVNKTASGLPCQRWDEETPHQKKGIYKTVNNFPDASLTGAENFCRNPASAMDSPWCYTMDPKVEWELCDIPKCSTDDVPGYASNQRQRYLEFWYSCRFEDRRLNVPTFKTVDNISRYGCMVACMVDENCQSLNYNKESRICELTRVWISSTVNLISSKDFEFWEKNLC